MQNERFNFRIAKEQIDLVDYLASLGHHPAKHNNLDYWYLSPLHGERTASFKVDRNIQAWYDHGTGQGGDLVGFSKEYHRCGYREALAKLREYLNAMEPTIRVKNPDKNPSPALDTTDKHIRIVAERPIEKYCLKQYIQGRNISLALAGKYLKEVDYSLYGKTYTALGFQNDAGGYELRNKYFKGSSMPKAPTIILLNEGKSCLSGQKLAVFEGFFSMLSFLELLEKDKRFADKPDNILVLNSLSFLSKSRDLTTAYGSTDLYLDNDTAGKKATEQALSWSPKLTDRSHLYEEFKDLNTCLCDRVIQHKVSREPIKSSGTRR